MADFMQGPSPPEAAFGPAMGMRAASLPNIRAAGSSQHNTSLSSEQPSAHQLREARKRTDMDAQVLANRIALLQQEGEKACKKIHDTRMLAEEMEALFEPYYDHASHRQQEIEAQKQKNQHHKRQGQIVRDSVRHAFFENRRQQAAEVRDKHKTMKDAKNNLDQSQHDMLLYRVSAIKSQTMGEEKRKSLEEARLAQMECFRKEKTNAGDIEKALRKNTESRISEMEQEESELIRWLQSKQMEQQDAYMALQSAAGKRRISRLGPKANSQQSSQQSFQQAHH